MRLSGTGFSKETCDKPDDNDVDDWVWVSIAGYYSSGTVGFSDSPPTQQPCRDEGDLVVRRWKCSECDRTIDTLETRQ